MMLSLSRRLYYSIIEVIMLPQAWCLSLYTVTETNMNTIIHDILQENVYKDIQVS